VTMTPAQEFAALTRSKEIYETLHPETKPEQPRPRHEPIIVRRTTGRHKR